MWGHRSLILRLSFGVSVSKVWEDWEDWAEGNLSRPKNGLQLFCQFNLCFLFFKSSIVYKNTFTTSV